MYTYCVYTMHVFAGPTYSTAGTQQKKERPMQHMLLAHSATCYVLLAKYIIGINMLHSTNTCTHASGATSLALQSLVCQAGTHI